MRVFVTYAICISLNVSSVQKEKVRVMRSEDELFFLNVSVYLYACVCVWVNREQREERVEVEKVVDKQEVEFLGRK